MDETNPVNNETSFDDIFEESDFEEPIEETEETAETAEETPEAEKEPENETKVVEEKPAEEIVDLKYMGRNIPVPAGEVKDIAARLGLSSEDIPTIIQKGMNYDRAVENTPLHKLVTRLAEANGQTVEDYQKFLETSVNQIAYDNEMHNVLAQHPDLDPATAAEIVNANLKNKNLTNYKNQVEKGLQEAQEARQSEEARLAPYRAFHEKYPDVAEFPEEVAKQIDTFGVDPTYAYEAYLQRQAQQTEIEKMKAELTQMKQKGLNYYSSMGSSKSAEPAETDDFMAGWDSF